MTMKEKLLTGYVFTFIVAVVLALTSYVQVPPTSFGLDNSVRLIDAAQEVEQDTEGFLNRNNMAQEGLRQVNYNLEHCRVDLENL